MKSVINIICLIIIIFLMYSCDTINITKNDKNSSGSIKSSVLSTKAKEQKKLALQNIDQIINKITQDNTYTVEDNKKLIEYFSFLENNKNTYSRKDILTINNKEIQLIKVLQSFFKQKLGKDYLTSSIYKKIDTGNKDNIKGVLIDSLLFLNKKEIDISRQQYNKVLLKRVYNILTNPINVISAPVQISLLDKIKGKRLLRDYNSTLKKEQTKLLEIQKKYLQKYSKISKSNIKKIIILLYNKKLKIETKTDTNINFTFFTYNKKKYDYSSFIKKINLEYYNSNKPYFLIKDKNNFEVLSVLEEINLNEKDLKLILNSFLSMEAITTIQENPEILLYYNKAYGNNNNNKRKINIIQAIINYKRTNIITYDQVKDNTAFNKFITIINK